MFTYFLFPVSLFHVALFHVFPFPRVGAHVHVLFLPVDVHAHVPVRVLVHVPSLALAPVIFFFCRIGKQCFLLIVYIYSY